MKQKNNRIESSLKEAFQNATPDLMDSILAECENEKGRILTMTNEKRFSRFTKWTVATAACLAMIVGGVVGYAALRGNTPAPTQPTTPVSPSTTVTPIYDTVATTVTLDVNPSLEIKVDANEKVLEVIALNEDAKAIIGNMSFEGNSLEMTVNTLVDSMMCYGFINETTCDILVSVDSKDETTATVIKNKLASKITDQLNIENIDGSVIGQLVSSFDTELSQLAKTHGITIGKAKFIKYILAGNRDGNFADYVHYSITELNKLLKASSEKEEPDYIGEEAALQIALDDLGLTLEQLDEAPEIKLVVERGEIVYMIKFKTSHFIDENNYSGSVTHFYVNAVTGKTPGKNVTEPNLTIEEAFALVCQRADVTKSEMTNLTMTFNDRESHLPMTYHFYFEANGKTHVALVDAMDGTIIHYEAK